MPSKFISTLLILTLCACTIRAGEDAPKLILKKGDRLAVVGDSITEQKLYSKYIELYVTACRPDLDLHVIQLGWSGERAMGFAHRMNNDLMPYKPTVVTTCYGMNDGSYAPFKPETGKNYENPMRDIVNRLKAENATVVVGAPGAVDTRWYGNPKTDPEKCAEQAKMYNETLAKLRDIAKQVATENGMPFANVHDNMINVMAKAKAALGNDYDVCGRDGVHPGGNGQLVMAYSFLKALGFDGDIGKITIDMKGEGAATEGHKVLSSAGGKTEIESTRSPFCFADQSLRSILPHLPFNQDLNRFVLVVKNLEGENASVTWEDSGELAPGTKRIRQTMTFTKAELAEGVNLADKFLDNPFLNYWRKLDELVSNKEGFETFMIKNAINSFNNTLNQLDKDPEAAAALDILKKKFFEKYEKKHATVRAAIAPVKHTLTITAK